MIVAERDISGRGEGESRQVIRGDGLNAHSKFRLNGISIHTEHVPKGNLPNVAIRCPIGDTRGAVFGRYEVIGRSTRGKRAWRRQYNAK